MKRIQDILPFVAHHFIDDEIELPAVGVKTGEYKASNLGLFHKYLNQLHDSWVLSTHSNGNSFTLQLNDFITHVFADALIQYKKLRINHSSLIFPLEITFETATVSYNLVNETGAIHPVEPFRSYQYIDEEILHAGEDYIHIAIVVWIEDEKKKGGHYGLVLIRSSNLRVAELQEQAWQKLFDERFHIYYDAFKKERDRGRYLGDQEICLALLSRIKQKSPDRPMD
ncbi:MAG: hypothetical protein EOP48_26645 [Sphingobacteriales bacterium]|nr:MAG: hypothetical protein EOP48_26645 [Sphingobacteriales bacterium]